MIEKELENLLSVGDQYMAINLSLEFEEIFRIQDALQYQQHRSCNSKARELNRLTFKLDQIVIKERDKLL